ncbi:hypothetical protein Q7P37_011595 [Cladosporium fusiforme]
MGRGDRPPSISSAPPSYDKPLPPLRTRPGYSWDDKKLPEIHTKHHVPLGSYDGKPLPPINDMNNEPALGPRKPNMSLFSLFSRPKVQKLRGYAESGLATPVLRDNNTSTADLNSDLLSPRMDIPRSTSSMSFRTHKTTNSGPAKKPRSSLRPSQDQKISQWDPPPLFQAFARSTINGLVEVSTASPETILAKSRNKNSGALFLQQEGAPRASTDTGRSGEMLRLGRFASRNSGSVHVTHVELERKIFVLMTTGHLLQYAEYGPSGRLPEKVLPLSENSAAFSSDLISGKPFVAQISQAVDDKGLPVPPASSLFSRVGIKNSAAKRCISNVLLVLPDGDELNTWLEAVRKQVEDLGGSPNNHLAQAEVHTRTASEINSRPESQSSSVPMHRYRIKRNSETQHSFAQLRDPVVSPIEQSQATEQTPVSPIKSDISLEEDEAFAEKLAAGASYSKPESVRGRSTSDAPSLNSSVAQSVDHLRLNSLRNSVRMSTHTNVTGWTSRTNSMTSENAPHKQSLDNSNEAYGSRGPYRNLSSYGTSKRRSAMPLPPPIQMPPRASIETTLQTKISSPTIREAAGGDESPVVGRNSTSLTALPPIAPRGKVLSSRQSMPLLSGTGGKSKITAPPPIKEDGERPTSFVGDLPASSHWTTKLSTSKRNSSVQPLPTERQMHRMSSAPVLRGEGVSSRATRRNTSQPFSLPLKINPSGAPGSGSWRSTRQANQQDASPPRIHTLEAHIAPQTDRPTMAPVSSQEDNIPHNPPAPQEQASNHQTSTQSQPATQEQAPTRQPSTTKRLSIFPPTQPHPPPGHNDNIPGRPPSVSIIPQHPDMTRSQLKRPIGIQIRTSPAAFLSSRQQQHIPQSATSTSSSSPSSATASPMKPKGTRSFTPPIRSLKPSRVAQPQRGNSFAFAQTPGAAKSRTSLPALDLGIPVVGLGPPAPPPSAPLPMPPTMGGGNGRSASPLPGTPARDGLGIEVGS